MAGKFELKKTKTGFTFNLKASNGQVILTSEVYNDKRGASNGIASVKKNAGIDARYEVRKSKKNEPYFVLFAANKEIIGKSEMYSSMRGCKNGMASVKKNAADAAVDDLTQ
ncbi:MAG: YegP family protein [Acidobacteria bacterium]|nr:YegP family protein [Acidobacteriota bacterium]